MGFSSTGPEIPVSTDADAIHDNASGEITAIPAATPASGDKFVFEDASDGDAKKSCDFDDLGGAGGPLNNFGATTEPGVGDDDLDGYEVGSLWWRDQANNDALYICADATTGAAVWHKLPGISPGAGNQFAGSSIPIITSGKNCYFLGDHLDGTPVGQVALNKIAPFGWIGIYGGVGTAPSLANFETNSLTSGSITKVYIHDQSLAAGVYGEILSDAKYITIKRMPSDAYTGTFVTAEVTGFTDHTTYVELDVTVLDDGAGGTFTASEYFYIEIYTAGGGGFADAPDAALFTERADHVNTPAAGSAEIWVKDEAPNVAILTDDAGNDVLLSSTANFTCGSKITYEKDVWRTYPLSALGGITDGVAWDRSLGAYVAGTGEPDDHWIQTDKGIVMPRAGRVLNFQFWIYSLTAVKEFRLELWRMTKTNGSTSVTFNRIGYSDTDVNAGGWHDIGVDTWDDREFTATDTLMFAWRETADSGTGTTECDICLDYILYR